MDETKLTVRVRREWLEGAKRFAQKNDTTLTRLVSEYLRQLSLQDDSFSDTPIVHRLLGILPEEASEQEYKDYLGAKYGLKQG